MRGITAQAEPSRDGECETDYVAQQGYTKSRQAASGQEVIENYLYRVFHRFGVSTRVELVLYCLQEREKGSAASAG